jgi:hypothetical protein
MGSDARQVLILELDSSTDTGNGVPVPLKHRTFSSRRATTTDFLFETGPLIDNNSFFLSYSSTAAQANPSFGRYLPKNNIKPANTYANTLMEEARAICASRFPVNHMPPYHYFNQRPDNSVTIDLKL